MLDLNWQRWVAACCGSYSLRGGVHYNAHCCWLQKIHNPS